MTLSYPALYHFALNFSYRIWNARLAYLASLLILLLQRTPLLRMLADGRLVHAPRFANILKFASATTAVHATGMHAVTGATQPQVSPVPPSTNPADATVGEEFVWVFSATLPGKKARSYLVEGLPPGIIYDGRVASNSFASLQGTPTLPGMFTVEITAFHFANHEGEASAVYELALNISGDAQPSPPVIITELADQFLKPGDSVVLVVEAEGEQLTFAWEKDGDPIPASNQPTLPLDNVTLAHAGTYTVKVTNDDGEASSSAEVTVATNEIPIPAGQTLYSLSARDATLKSVNPDGSSQSSIAITMDGHQVTGGTGLALDPETDNLFAILKLSAPPATEVGDRVLATLNPATGKAVLVGNPGASALLKFAALAFDDQGRLYGVTGDDQGAESPETLFTIDKTTAVATEFLPLGNGDQGEALTFDPDSGLLIHASGGSSPQTQVLESIDPETKAISPLAPQGTWSEGRALLAVGDGQYLIADEEKFNLLSAESDVVPLGPLDHVTKGLALVPDIPARFDITRVERNDEGVVLVFPVEPGDEFAVESSQDLIIWDERARGTAATDQSEIEFADTEINVDVSERFYRASRQ